MLLCHFKNYKYSIHVMIDNDSTDITFTNVIAT